MDHEFFRLTFNSLIFMLASRSFAIIAYYSALFGGSLSTMLDAHLADSVLLLYYLLIENTRLRSVSMKFPLLSSCASERWILLSACSQVESMFECARCGKVFLTAQAEYGHRSMCPNNPERSLPDGWNPQTHGRWKSDEGEAESV